MNDIFEDVRMKLDSGMTWDEIREEHRRKEIERGQVWLETDAPDDLIYTSEQTAVFAGKLLESVMWWKWIIIGSHNLLQGACVCALRGLDTSGISVLSGSLKEPKSNMARVWAWLNADSESDARPLWPGEKLASLLTLYHRVTSEQWLPKPYTLQSSAPSIEKDMELLNELRNEFIHFVPKGWALETSGLPRIIRHVGQAVEHLTITHRAFSLDEEQQKRLARALAALRANLEQYESRLELSERS